MVPDPNAQHANAFSSRIMDGQAEDTVRQMLVEHGISIDLFGQGRAKKFSEFAAEARAHPADAPQYPRRRGVA